MNTLGLMVNVGYLKMEEVPGIPRLATTPAVVIYAPLATDTGGARCRARLRHAGAPDAAARGGDARAGRRDDACVAAAAGRPTCMAIPAALSSGVASSLGCIGNRVYTGITDDEFYTVIAGKDLASVVGADRHDHVGQRRADRLSPGTTGVACDGVERRVAQNQATRHYGSSYTVPTLERGISDPLDQRAIARVASERLEARLGVEHGERRDRDRPRPDRARRTPHPVNRARCRPAPGGTAARNVCPRARGRARSARAPASGSPSPP